MLRTLSPSGTAKLLRERLINKKTRNSNMEKLLEKQPLSRKIKHKNSRKSKVINDNKPTFFSPNTRNNKLFNHSSSNIALKNTRILGILKKQEHKIFNEKKSNSVTKVKKKIKRNSEQFSKILKTGDSDSRRNIPSSVKISRNGSYNGENIARKSIVFNSPNRNRSKRKNIATLIKSPRDYKNLLSKSRSIKKLRDRIDGEVNDISEKLSQKRKIEEDYEKISKFVRKKKDKKFKKKKYFYEFCE